MPSDPRFSWNPIADLQQLWTLHSMVNAFRAGAVIAIAAGVVGWFMVLRRQTFAGHTIAMAGFPGAAGAVLVGMSPWLGYFAFCVGAAVVLSAVVRRGEGGFAQESAVTGAVQAFVLACGMLFVALYHGFLEGANALLFGSFLAITDAQVVTLTVVCVVVLVTMGVIGRPLLFASVDPDVAAARGIPVRTLSVVFLILLGAATAETSQISGSLLVFALLVMPAATAQRITARPAASLVLTVVIGVGATWIGLIVANFSPYPAGFSVTSVAFGFYVIASVAPPAVRRLDGFRRVRAA